MQFAPMGGYERLARMELLNGFLKLIFSPNVDCSQSEKFWN
jgi:hypothetical protein